MVQELALLTWCDICHLEDDSKVSADLIKIPRTKDLKAALCDKHHHIHKPLLDAIQKLGITDEQAQPVKPKRSYAPQAFAVAPGLPWPNADQTCPLPACEGRAQTFTTSRGWHAHLINKHPDQTPQCDQPGCGKRTCNLYQHYYNTHPGVPRAHLYGTQVKAVRQKAGQDAPDVPGAT
jgi:hypothetical protein